MRKKGFNYTMHAYMQIMMFQQFLLLYRTTDETRT